MVLGVQELAAPLTDSNSVAVAASTLVVAALFQPVRRRVQTIVDRRFNRSGYDAERMAAAFGSRLRDQLDLASVRSDLMETVSASIGPRTIAVWIRKESTVWGWSRPRMRAEASNGRSPEPR